MKTIAIVVVAMLMAAPQTQAFDSPEDVEEFFDGIDDAYERAIERSDEIYEKQDALSDRIDRAIDADVSDAEFDRLMRQMDALDAENDRIDEEYEAELDLLESIYLD